MRRPDIVDMISEALHREIPNAEVYLFGSEARGDARMDSDIDLMVLLDQPKVTSEDKDRVIAPLYDIELSTSTIIHSLIYTKSYWENRPMDYFKLNVLKEGVRI